MTSHKGHSHPATAAARAQCRKAQATIAATAAMSGIGQFEQSPQVKATMRRAEGRARKPRIIAGAHCQECGSTDNEDIMFSEDGYSNCCNEIIVWDCDNYLGTEQGTCYHS